MGSRRVREISLLILGVVTPVGVLVVNGSAFVMRHLTEFRVGIATCAVLSSLLLNALTAWWVLGRAGRATPDLYAEYRRWAIALAAVIVLATTAGAGYFTYQGMSDTKRLPDPLSVIASALALLVPFTFAFIARRMTGHRSRRPAAGSGVDEALTQPGHLLD